MGEGIVGNMEMETIEQPTNLRQSWVSTVGLCTLLRLSNTNMGMVLLEQAWVFWLGELMQQVQWAMVRLRLGAGEVSMVGRMERMIRGRLSQPKFTGQERRTAHAHTVSCSDH